MSLPLNVITPEPVVADFLAPWDEPYLPMEESVTGGVAIGDGSQGRQVQRWTIFYEGGIVKVAPESGPVQFTRATPDVQTLSLAFDSNMAVAYAWQSPAGSNLYFFNSLIGGYDTLTIGDGTSCRVGVDDPRRFNEAASDVIFAYTRDGELYWRQQRDRYTIERHVGHSAGRVLRRCAPNKLNRLQFLLGPLNEI